jgi:hypothetical protein
LTLVGIFESLYNGRDHRKQSSEVEGIVLRHRLFAFFVLPTALSVVLIQPATAGLAAQTPGPSVLGNSLVDQDHNLSFSSNKQNETSVTRDPVSGVLVAGANDEIGEGPCPGTAVAGASPCPFQKGVGVSGYYRSIDGKTWTGGILRGTPGRASGGDPSLDNGPGRCPDGHFSYACGTVIYYASLEDPVDPDLHYSEATGVARSFDDGATWQTPVEVSSVSKANFDDHEWLAVDNKNPASPYYGSVYVFWAVYCANCAGNGSVKLYVAFSRDSGQTWSNPAQVSGANNNIAQGFRETGQLAVSSSGTVEAFWSENEDTTHTATIQVVATSTDGGLTFTKPITISSVVDYPISGTPFDVVDLYNRVPGMSARVDCYPHPAADPTSTSVYVVWCDFASGNGNGNVKAAVSSDGINWTKLGVIAAVRGRNAFFPAVAVAPGGIIAVAFNALTAPPNNNLWQTGVQVYDNYYVESKNGGASFTAPLRVSTQSSNPEASSYNNLKEQFIGDYIGIVAGPTQATVVWTDSRNAALCAAVSAYRSSVYAGMTSVAPNPGTACAPSFGNTDTYAANVAY